MLRTSPPRQPLTPCGQTLLGMTSRCIEHGRVPSFSLVGGEPLGEIANATCAIVGPRLTRRAEKALPPPPPDTIPLRCAGFQAPHIAGKRDDNHPCRPFLDASSQEQTRLE